MSTTKFPKTALAAALALVTTATFTTPAVATQLNLPPIQGAYVPGELLVGFNRATSSAARSAIHGRHGVAPLHHFEEIGVDLVRLVPGLEVASARSAYLGERSVRFAEPNYIRHAYGLTPNDSQFLSQWAHRNTGQIVEGVVGTIDSDIDSSELGVSPDAWEVSTGSTDTVVAIIDTGVDIGHADLAANIWTNPGETPGNGIDDDGNGFIDDVNGWDFANDDNSVYDPAETCPPPDPLPRNDDHGTHVAGIIGAVGNNSRGVAGVNWQTRIMPLKFLSKQGILLECGTGAVADAVEAILYATRMGARFINASWGGPDFSHALREAFIAAGQGGVLFAAAAGNGGADGIGDDLSNPIFSEYPASYDLDNEIVVAASNNRDGIASFSNFGGPTDLAAPGVSILSTFTEGAYASISGTSMATPFVTGTLALLRSQYPGAPPSELKARILGTVDAKPAFASPKTQTGGRLNLKSALRQVRPVAPTLTAPNGGEALNPEASKAITWETNIPPDNPSTNYRIEYTTDAFVSQSAATGFESGITSEFNEPVDSDAPWATAATAPHPGGPGALSARSGTLDNDEASWMSTTRRFSAPGSVNFWYRVSSENCESAQQPVCGDYLRFFIDGVPVLGSDGRGFAGEVPWTQVSFPIAPGTHTLSWSYQKDQLCPGLEPDCLEVEEPEDAAWIDDVTITGIDNVTWSLVTDGATGASFIWTVPNVFTSAAKVRLCQDTGDICQHDVSDESDGVFSIGRVKLTESGGSTNVTEGGASDTYTIQLFVQPSADVAITITSGSELSVSPTSLTFTPSNWRSPQTVIVSAVDDTVVEEIPHLGSIAHSVSSADSAYNDLPVPPVSVTISDNDPSSDNNPSPSLGYWLVARDGGIFSFGEANFYGSTGNIKLNQPIVGMASTPSGNGYWFVAADGGVFSFGDAGFFGSTGNIKLNQPIVGMASTPSGNGYWLVASDGGIFSFGDAGFFGSTGNIKLNQPIVGMASTPSGHGYWLVASDGGIFAFGDAGFYGSTGAIKLNKPVVGMAPSPSGNGYWFVASDGGIFSFGDAGFFGSTGAMRLNQPIVGMASNWTGKGYWLVASDGGIFAFGDAGFYGSTGNIKLNQPIVGMSSS